ncbi:molybdopterin biosynthesis protein MoeB [Chromobacterium sp. Panama]|uniref:ThiF family adenylyltransferase n=1 Tax=Chromobacterium sp. Panama TaxID=2161826 RepID=UPI000D325F88|nr:ThiF family adenylyltransferase [Chromobacterium sp. Panama]PTU64225.1 molybdopterin biosynthesis protein MoeB [Chromobacterium sp. Panama]
MSHLAKLLGQARRTVCEVEADTVNVNSSCVIIDCREPEESSSGVIPGALCIPRGLLESKVERLVADKGQPIIIYCASGVRSLLAAKTLHEMGYAQVTSLAGGIEAWKASGGTLSHIHEDTQFDRERYLSQLKLPDLGEAGQARLKRARVLIIGAGGLGSPVALYLAAAGVGTLTLVDHDTVDKSNLQRQILHTSDRIGLAKVESAWITLRALNPEVNVGRLQRRFDFSLAQEIVPDHDVVVDGTDNFTTRYLVNHVCHRFNKYCVHGSVYQWQGQVAVFGGEGPCYECVFPEAPDGEMAPNCAEGGVLGAVTGIVGAAMACEVIKLLCGIEGGLTGAMASFDLKGMDFARLKLDRDPRCNCCSMPRESDVYRAAKSEHCYLRT